MSGGGFLPVDGGKKNTKPGGFFAPLPGDEGTNSPFPLRKAPEEPVYFPDLSMDHCSKCSSLEIDPILQNDFNVLICYKCKKDPQFEDDYSYITKTGAKSEFLLTDEELNDRQRLPHVEKSNPHMKTWHPMQLFLKLHVRKFSYEKWDGPDGLAREMAQRQQTKQDLKQKRYSRKLEELRKKTRSSTSKAQSSAKKMHQHVFEQVGDMQICKECGLRTESEEL